ncbi:MAG: hypothetical protein ACXWR1_16640, partial [Bdellovibrionota bacterium]
MKPIFSLSLFFLCLSAPAARAEDAPAGGKELTIEEFLQSLSTVKEVVQRRDPFAEMMPPFEAPATQSAAEDPNAPVMSAPILERYPITDYEVVAVLLGDQYPRALLRLPPETGSTDRKVVIVKEEDKLGNRKGLIKKITLEGLVVQQAQRSAHGFVDKTEVLLKVGAKADEQRRALV